MGAPRIGPLSRFARPWNEGGWIPWSVLAFGLAVFAVMFGVMVIYLGKTAIVVDIKDPAVQVAVMGTTLTLTGPEKESVKVEPGDQEAQDHSPRPRDDDQTLLAQEGETRRRSRFRSSTKGSWHGSKMRSCRRRPRAEEGIKFTSVRQK